MLTGLLLPMCDGVMVCVFNTVTRCHHRHCPPAPHLSPQFRDEIVFHVALFKVAEPAGGSGGGEVREMVVVVVMMVMVMTMMMMVMVITMMMTITTIMIATMTKDGE